jgi:hypothetical protein
MRVMYPGSQILWRFRKSNYCFFKKLKLNKLGNIIKVIKLIGTHATYTACRCQTKEFGRKTSSEARDHVRGLNLGNKIITKWILREICRKNVDLIELPQDRFHWQVPVSMVMSSGALRKHKIY